MKQLQGNERYEDCPYFLRPGVDNDKLASPLSVKEKERFDELHEKKVLTDDEKKEHSDLGSRWQLTVFPFKMPDHVAAEVNATLSTTTTE